MTAPATTTNVQAPTLDNFLRDFLITSGYTPTQGDLTALSQVAKYEGQNGYYNPLNVTQPEPGSTSINSAGVQAFSSFDSGVAGTVALFKDPAAQKAGIPQALASGSQAKVQSAFQTFYQSWGSSIPFGTLSPAPGSQTVGATGSTGGFSTGAGQTTTQFDPFGVVSDFSSAGNAIGSIWGDLTSASFWLRVGLALIGFVILLIAVDKLTGGALSSGAASIGSSTDASSPSATPGSTTPVAPAAPAPVESGRHQAGTRRSSGPVGKHRGAPELVGAAE